jgi:hypothetical protein
MVVCGLLVVFRFTSGIALVALIAVAAAASPPFFTRGDTPIEAGPTMATATSCRSCHAAIVDEWQGSRHAAAWTNGLFQTEWQALPRAWCVNCHAPLSSQQQDLSGSFAGEGITCAVCHVRNNQFSSRHKRPQSPHDTKADDNFGSPRWCGGCHEFNFPRFGGDGAFAGTTDLPMQATVAEFERGPFASLPTGCLTCHGSDHGHAFLGAHDAGMLRRAVQLDVCRVGNSVRLTVTNSGAGHEVPTGDVHRHMALRAWLSAAPELLFQAYLGRKFEGVVGGGNRVTSDTRVKPGQSLRFQVAATTLGATLKDDINVELRYVYSLDESTSPGHDPGERTWQIVDSKVVTLATTPRCP